MTRAVGVACAAAGAGILAAKFFLAGRIGINWDEFYFLSHVYALGRGELDLLLQGAYTHAFTWITATGGHEVDQVVRLRLVMCTLLVLSAVLLYALARLWASRAAALVAVLAFLSTWPVIKHGGSFRADALILPLTLAAFYFALRGNMRVRGSTTIAGACIGIAFVVSVKAVLLLPALVLMAVLPDLVRDGTNRLGLASRIRNVIGFFVFATVVAVALLALHSTQIAAAIEPAGSFASRTLQVTILDVPFAPRSDYLLQLVSEDGLYWLALLAGLLVAVRQRSYAAAASILALTPVLFYRNAFPYYYPVMLAPPSILIAIAVDELLARSSRRGRAAATFTVAAGCVALMAGAWDSVMTLRFDRQLGQRAVVAAVHRIFPEPVPYLDHSGMIASFPKVNFFMSGWGVEAYLNRGTDFMPEALARRCPPLLVVNHPVLTPRTLLYRGLRETDRQLLETHYVDYWGPVRLAGAEAELGDAGPSSVSVPCAGDYRLESEAPVLIDGRSYGNGAILTLESKREYHVAPAEPNSLPQRLRLRWAGVHEPPNEPPPKPALYDAL